MKRNQALQRVRIIKMQLKRHPPVCPICKNKLQFGYLGGLYTFFFWWPKEKKLPFFIGKARNKCLSSLFTLPSYICKTCHLTITQYKKISTKSIVDVTETNEIGDELDVCPYCGQKPLMGYIFGSGGLYCIPFITWSERYSWKSKKVYLTAYPLLGWTIQKVPTKKCTNCGIIYSRYEHGKIRKSNVIGLIVWALLMLICVGLYYL